MDISGLYNTYLPYALYGPPILPVLIMIIMSFILWITSFTTDEWLVHVIESTSVIAGFVMIIGQCIIAEYGDQLKVQYENIKTFLFNSRREDHIYDNLPHYHRHKRSDYNFFFIFLYFSYSKYKVHFLFFYL
jgi:hypothetical protein